MPHNQQPNRPPPQTEFRPEKPPPHKGGSRGYSQDVRDIVMRLLQDGVDVDDLATKEEFPSIRTIYRWQQCYILYGHTRPFVQQGNAVASVLRGHQLFLMALFRAAHPHATAAEVAVFLLNTQPVVQRRLNTASQITEGEKHLGLVRVVGSLTAHQAKLPVNVMKRWMFWNMAPPYGVAGVARSDLIDIDEAGIFLETVGRKYGKCYVGKRVRGFGPYGHSVKWMLVMAIEGGPTGRRWVQMVQRAGTSTVDFYLFILGILNSIPRGNNNSRRVFIMDNLSSHRSAIIRQLIMSYGHYLVFRAPYYPVDGPIEYVFNTIQQRLQNEYFTIKTQDQLYAATNRIIHSINDFENYFTHCGY